MTTIFTFIFTLISVFGGLLFMLCYLFLNTEEEERSDETMP